MKEKHVQIINLILHTFVVILGSIAIFMQFQKSLAGNSLSVSGWHMFRFFTNDGNIFCLIVSLINVIFIIYSLIKKKEGLPKWLYLLNLASAVSGLLIFLTVVFVLWPMVGPYLFVGYIMIVLHVLNPVLVSLSFIVTMHHDVKKIEGLLGMVPMALYGIPVLTLIITKVWTKDLIPYPFLKIYDNPWWATTLMLIGMFGGSALAGVFLLSITKNTNIIHVSKKKLLITCIIVGTVVLAITTLVVILNIMY